MITISAASLAGWVFDLHLSRDLLPNSPEMKPNAAAAFLLSCIGLLFTTRGSGTRLKHAVCSICGVLVFLIGSITLGEYIFGFDARLDGMLLPIIPSGSASGADLRITTYVSANFAIIGLALATLTWSRPFRKISTYLSFFSLIVSYAAVLGHLFGAEYIYGIPSSNGTSPYAAVFFMIFTIGLLAANFDSSATKLLTSTSLGGSMARKLLPAVVLIPTFVGWLRTLGQDRGLYDTGFGAALMIFVCVTLMCGIVFFICSTVHKADKRRKLAEEELVEKERRYRELFDYGQSLICIHDVNGDLTTVNPAVLASLGYDREEIVGKNIRDFMPDEHKVQFPAFLRQINSEGISDGTFSLVTKSGKRVIWQYHSIMVWEPGQEPYI
ncbi:MAG TPA: PAS domain S-box protein, partial [Pyrinomonadaceae bacterium]|nr:PAS domain S-box protein [Pyrinomonadaceae bacterium]